VVVLKRRKKLRQRLEKDWKMDRIRVEKEWNRFRMLHADNELIKLISCTIS